MVMCTMQGLSCALAVKLPVLAHALQGNPMVRTVMAVMASWLSAWGLVPEPGNTE